jgi:hypothetical protein
MVSDLSIISSIEIVLFSGKKFYPNISGQQCRVLFSMMFLPPLLKLSHSGKTLVPPSFFTLISFFSGFNTTVDVKLQQWAAKELPRQCVHIGHLALLDEFQALLEREQKSRSHDPIAYDLKMQVVQVCRSRHQWDTKALDLLVRIFSDNSI